MENNIYGYDNDSTLVFVVPSPGESVGLFTESSNRDLNQAVMCCESEWNEIECE